MLKVLKILFPNYPWSANVLQKEARWKDFIFQNGSIRCVGQPDGHGTEYEWELTVERQWAEALMQARKRAEEEEQRLVRTEMLWNGMILRSPAEVAVAEALQKRGVLFFANAKCRLLNRSGQLETWETDFLVFYKGTSRILEVDGWTFHQEPSVDYKRDRMFDREGIRTSRFTASECFENADAVIAEFLEFFEI